MSKYKTHPSTLTDKGWLLVCGDYLRYWWKRGMQQDDAIYSSWFAKLTEECTRRRLIPWRGSL